jgi:hypothetical protein
MYSITLTIFKSVQTMLAYFTVELYSLLPLSWSNVSTIISQHILMASHSIRFYPRKPKWRGGLSTVNLLVQTSLDQLLLQLKILFTYVTIQPNLMRRSTVLDLPLQLVFPVLSHRRTSLKVFLRSVSKIHNTSFSSELTNGPNKLECYIDLGWRGLLITNTLTYQAPFVSYEERVLWIRLLRPAL